MSEEERAAYVIEDPAAIGRELQLLTKSGRHMASRKARIKERFPGKWVAVHGAAVKAHGPTRQVVVEEIAKKGIPEGETLIQYIDTTPRILIL